MNILGDYNKSEVLKYIKHVGIYLRRSRGDIDTDLEKHSEVIYDFVKKNKLKYVEYKEIGSGSTITERVEIKHLIKDIKEELFDAIIVFDWDRLTRGSAADAEKITGALRLSGTLVITMSPFNVYDMNDESDEEMLSYKSFFANREYKIITKRMHNGKKIGARMGLFVYGVPNYGYSYNKDVKGLEPDKEESKVFRRMVDGYINGKSLNKIATELNDMNVPSPRGKKWNGNTIKNIITNEVYLGRIISNKTSGVKLSQNPDGTKKPFKEHPKDEWIVVENCHEPLMNEDELMQIREILRSKANHHNGNGRNTLSGLVKCGLCGETLTIQKSDGNTFFKKCGKCKDNKGGGTYLVEDILKNRLKDFRKTLLQNKDRLHSQKSRLGEIEGKIRSLERDNEKHNKAINRIQAAFEEGEGIYDDLNEVKDRVKERRNKISNNSEEISYLVNKLNNANNSSEKDKIKRIEELYKEISSGENPAVINKLYKEIVHKIEWLRTSNDRINIKIYIK
ncbi:recombinase family protein [Oceanobacillus sp. FSL H7-0719]|uniref:recombinase family protein n=1 Tax=Oceanobacillus sp. FSL H7-0719 TaxID=2954507 RepID=UPI00324C4552